MVRVWAALFAQHSPVSWSKPPVMSSRGSPLILRASHGTHTRAEVGAEPEPAVTVRRPVWIMTMRAATVKPIDVTMDTRRHIAMSVHVVVGDRTPSEPPVNDDIDSVVPFLRLDDSFSSVSLICPKSSFISTTLTSRV
ncbi:hypothetical protein NP493_555g01063 [Ridgeia piscesae]|uniref:Uncharacterized protein n=1 Tax=Ridgeia piscesae TaxID=27915 RepID=A0AAD9NQ22_RIDPI|nr:hypothetical protein NP493_555g01063 [Ridgeia piscesae]